MGHKHVIPSGKLTFCHGKSPCSMGKSTISMAMFNSYLYVYQRVYPSNIPLNHYKIPLNHHKSHDTRGFVHQRNSYVIPTAPFPGFLPGAGHLEVAPALHGFPERRRGAPRGAGGRAGGSAADGSADLGRAAGGAINGHGTSWGHHGTCLPSGKHTNIAIENGPVEIVDLPIDSMVIFHSYGSLPEGNRWWTNILPWKDPPCY